MRLWVIAYDIADDVRRRRLASALGRRAVRVQESVFEGWLNAIEVRALLAEAAALIEPTVDALRAYPLAGNVSSRRRTLGDASGAPRPPGFWIV